MLHGSEDLRGARKPSVRLRGEISSIRCLAPNKRVLIMTMRLSTAGNLVGALALPQRQSIICAIGLRCQHRALVSNAINYVTWQGSGQPFDWASSVGLPKPWPGDLSETISPCSFPIAYLERARI